MTQCAGVTLAKLTQAYRVGENTPVWGALKSLHREGTVVTREWGGGPESLRLGSGSVSVWVAGL